MACVQSDFYDAALPEEVRWEESKRLRYNCELATSLLREQVPVLDFVEWRVSLIEQGRVHTVLPLNSSSTNEHCTHQAALLFLAADYTGGIALASLIPHWPVIGIHPVAPGEKPIAMWLVKGEIKFYRPSVGCLDIMAEVDPGRHDRVRSRHAQGKTILETITIRFRNGAVEVGEATMTYYARQSDKLRCDGTDPDKVNILYQHKLVSSAELIAGMRARESGGLFEDPFAARIAGEHGAALAARFSEKSPQHGPMIAARTRHLDSHILEYVRSGGRDLVLLGAGYDMRPFRLSLPTGMRVYELDFSTVLTDRQRRLDAFGIEDQDSVTRIQVPIDLRATTAATALEGIVDFTSPIFIAWEGMSMYFEEAEVRAMLAGMVPLLRNNRSRLWLDLADERVIVQPDIFPEVKAFVRRIEMLGEPFIFGVESVKKFMESNGFRCRETVCSDVYLADHTDPVYSLYHFCIASAEAAPPIGVTAGEESWTAHPAHLTTPLAIKPEKALDNEAAKT
ncbi:MAG: class I SAM-dependent methyltransferase [Thermoguttaceae bacterium]